MRRRQTDVPGIPLQLEMGRGPERGVNFLGLGRVQRLLEVHEAPRSPPPGGPSGGSPGPWPTLRETPAAGTPLRAFSLAAIVTKPSG